MKLNESKIVVEHVFSLLCVEIDGVIRSHPVSNEYIFLLVLYLIHCCLIC